jgi:hypothetical protein
MPTATEQLTTIKANYLASLAADSINPKPDYSIDGQAVNRGAWRSSLLQTIKEIDELLALQSPIEYRTQVL